MNTMKLIHRLSCWVGLMSTCGRIYKSFISGKTGIWVQRAATNGYIDEWGPSNTENSFAVLSLQYNER